MNHESNRLYAGGGIRGQDGGMLALLAGQIGELVRSRFVSQKFFTFMAKLSQEDLTTLGRLIESGKVTPVIDRCYQLSEVPEAVRYLSG